MKIGLSLHLAVISGNVDQQPTNGLAPPFLYILFSAVLFLFAQEVLKESQTKQEVICSHIKGTKRNEDGQDKEREQLTLT